MGKRKHRDPAERAARQERRAERAVRSQAEALRMALLDAGVQPEDIVDLQAEGFVGKRVSVTGELVIPVTPLDEDGNHDSTTTTG